MTTKANRGNPNPKKANAKFGVDRPQPLKMHTEQQYHSYFLTKEELEDYRNGVPINRPWFGGDAS